MQIWNHRLLYAILDLGYVHYERAPTVARQLLSGGADILQLRAKNYQPASLLPLAKELSKLCQDAGIPFVVNDHPQLAAEAGADAVHVGQDDMTVREAKTLSRGLLVGKSTHSIQQVAAAMSEMPDYIGFGPLYATPTKPDYPPIGLHHIREATATSRVPVFCIGGINRHNLREVILAGAQRVVIVSALLLAQDITLECRRCKQLITEWTAAAPSPQPSDPR